MILHSRSLLRTQFCHVKIGDSGSVRFQPLAHIEKNCTRQTEANRLLWLRKETQAVLKACHGLCRSCAVKKQTGVTLRYMLDFGANPKERQLKLSAQFLHNELPVRLAHRVAELENLPYGLSAKPHVLKVHQQSIYLER